MTTGPSCCNVPYENSNGITGIRSMGANRYVIGRLTSDCGGVLIGFARRLECTP